jgi:hypothetical protein
VLTDYAAVPFGFPIAAGSVAGLSYQCTRLGEPHTTHSAQIVVFAQAASDTINGPAVLRLSDPVPGAALRLAMDGPAIGDRIFLLQPTEDRPVPRLSIGSVRIVSETDLRYDAESTVGSGGAPVLGADWTVLGMHYAAEPGSGVGPGLSFGLSLASILEVLRSTEVWPEIARTHRLVQLTAEPLPLGRRRLRRRGGPTTGCSPRRSGFASTQTSSPRSGPLSPLTS